MGYIDFEDLRIYFKKFLKREILIQKYAEAEKAFIEFEREKRFK